MNNRIEYVDLAKGICMVVIILGHLYINTFNLYVVAMPLFFVLSGWFFKVEDSFSKILLKKTNTLLIPFLFFYIISYLLFYFGNTIAPGLIRTSATGIFDVFTQRMYFDGPIWFLICLYWINLITALIVKTIRRAWFQILLILLIGYFGILLGRAHCFFPCMIDVAMTSLPFFYSGIWLRRINFFQADGDNKKEWLSVLGFASVSIATCYITENPHIGFAGNNIYGNVLFIYLISFSGVIAALLSCKKIGYLPFFNYFGRYSLIPLCLHHLIYRPLVVIANLFPIEWLKSPYVIALITILICWGCIPLCLKYIPKFVGKEPLLVIKQ